METARNFTVSHQILSLFDIDFTKQRIHGFTELTINPLVNDLHTINLNCKQCKIYSVVFNGAYEASFEYNDPTLMVIAEDDERRDLQTFLTQKELAISSVDADDCNGELTITIPFECQQLLQDQQQKILHVAVEFLLEKPTGSIQFYVPPNVDRISADDDETVDCPPVDYLFTCDHNANVWFPCVNSYSELCTWKIEVATAVDKLLTVIASGDLIEKKTSSDDRTITHHYFLSVPTCAANIGLVIGQFESHTDEQIAEITSYCLPQLMSLMKTTTAFIHEVFEFYEEYTSTHYPFSSYKQVFVNNAYDQVITYSTLAIFNINLLHPSTIIDQTLITRRLLATAVASQFFGRFLVAQTNSDCWLVDGIAEFLAGFYYRKTFGNNEYKHILYKDLKAVGKYEKEHGFILLDYKYDAKERAQKCHYSVKHHSDMMSSEYRIQANKKSHLVMRLIDDCLGSEITAQLLNKLLSAASSAASMKYDQPQVWSSLQLSTDVLLKLLPSLTTPVKDIKPLLDQWVYKSGFARFNGSFQFNRKNNKVEIELRQDMLNHRGCRKYIGPITIIIQELDGSFAHTIQLEENTTRYDIQCHSKMRRNKKKKILLSNGEEIDMDLSKYDTDTSVLWIRIDPEMKLLRDIKFEQPDHHWQNQLHYERDIVSQFESIDALQRFPSITTRTILTTIVENMDMYYQVRVHAAYALADIANKMNSNWNGPLALLSSFKKMYMSHGNFIKYNNFTDLSQYFLQKNMPIAMGALRTVHNVCPNEIIRFLLDLIRLNENGKNRFSDVYYKAALIDALAATITSTAYAASVHEIKSTNLTQDARAVIEEIVLRLNLEKLVPTYRYVVTSSCLSAVRQLQKHGHIPENIVLFKQYTVYGTFEDVRKTAFEIIVRCLEVRNDENLMNYLLDYIETDPSHMIRHHILRCLCKHPPFTPSKQQNSDALNTDRLVNKLWKLINEPFFDYRLRNDLVDLYNTLYGLSKPKCLSKQATTKETLKLSDGIQPIKLF